MFSVVIRNLILISPWKTIEWLSPKILSLRNIQFFIMDERKLLSIFRIIWIWDLLSWISKNILKFTEPQAVPPTTWNTSLLLPLQPSNWSRIIFWFQRQWKEPLEYLGRNCIYIVLSSFNSITKGYFDSSIIIYPWIFH